MASISSIYNKCTNFISALKSPTYIDFMIKKIIKIKDIKISHLGTFKQLGNIDPKPHSPQKGSLVN
jgi:hypothetical protein